MADEMQTNNAEVQQAVTAALEEQKKKKKKKRLIIFGIILAVIVVIGIAAGSDSGSDTGSNNVQAPASGEATQDSNAAVASKNDKNNVGKFKIELKNSRITKDYDGNSILVVTYGFTNNDTEAKAFSYSVEDKAYQNGVELGDVWTSYGIDNYSFEEQTKEIKPGVSLDVQCAYKLNDKTSDVQIEFTQFFSDRVQQSYTIKIS